MNKVLVLTRLRMFSSGVADRAFAQFWKCIRAPFTLDNKQANPLLDYPGNADHLFLPPTFSIKRQILSETIVVLVIGFGVLISFIGIISVLFSTNPLVVLSLFLVLFYLVFFAFKMTVIVSSLRIRNPEVTAEDIAALKSEELPIYSVFVPLRDEAEVMDQIVFALSSIDYPAHKLDLVVTVEQFDVATKTALARANLPSSWRVVELPDTLPKTKPKAMNCAFLQAKGKYLVIYDAEIIPDTDQLKKAFLMFKKHPEYAALQSRLDHYNTYQNLITRLFTMEFTFHYDLFMPGLMKYKLPVPLSGHSTHFRTSALGIAGGWDPYNVAEDCEVGMRLFRLGYRAGFLDSVSQEEAASTLKSWIAQRTRWMKGFIQTAIVHLRYPRLSLHQMGGWRNFLVFLLLVPGTVLINILNLVFWIVLLIWLIWQPEVIQMLYPLPILYTANFVAICGGFVFVYLNTIALYRRGKFSLIRFWFFVPVYWIMLAYATVRAAKQTVTAPHLWEKTTHGTHIAHSKAKSV